MDIWCFSFDKYLAGVLINFARRGSECVTLNLARNVILSTNYLNTIGSIGTVKSSLLSLRVLVNRYPSLLSQDPFCFCTFYIKLSSNFNYFKSLNRQRERGNFQKFSRGKVKVSG